MYEWMNECMYVWRYMYKFMEDTFFEEKLDGIIIYWIPKKLSLEAKEPDRLCYPR